MPDAFRTERAPAAGLTPYFYGHRHVVELESLHRMLLNLRRLVPASELGMVDHCLDMLEEAFPDPVVSDA